MPRKPKPYYKKSHKCWYVNLGGRQERLAPDEETAWKMYYALMAGDIEPSENLTVRELINAFLAWVQRNQKPATHCFYEKWSGSFRDSVPPNLQVRKLKPYHVTKWLDQRFPHEVSPNTILDVIRCIQRPFNWAVDEGIIKESPVARIKKPTAVPRDVYLTPEQFDEFLSKVRDQEFADIVETLRETGCRPQEARRVEARHFDRENQCWVFPPEESKGGRESRTVLLTDRAFEITQRLALKYPEGPIFRNSRGQPWTGGQLRGRCFKLRKKLGFHVCPYAIRHTFATDAIIRGVDLITIAELMGHKNLNMLNKIYQHVGKRSDHLREGLRRATGRAG